MADNTKKGGARDISELKARLGLKKGGGGASAAGGGVPPPSAAKIGGGYVPPPPGAHPAQPVIPDARVDPFGAMNAIAAQGAQRAQAAPQIIVVNDGQPVESVATRGKTVYLKWAGIVLVPMIAGIAIGGVVYKNEEYNKTIDDAKKLTEDTRAIGKPLQALNDQMLLAKERGPGRNSFLTNDKQLTAALEGISIPLPDSFRIFHSHLYNMDPKLVEDTLRFYSDVALLSNKLKVHVNLSKSDQKVTSTESDLYRRMKEGARFGIAVMAPQQEGVNPMAEVVQLGSPICKQGDKPNPAGCGSNDPYGMEYRPDLTAAAWGALPIAKTVGPNQLYMLRLDDNSTVARALLQGAQQFYGDFAYMRRIEEVEAMTKALLETRKSIENRLNQKAQESKRFSL